MSLVIEGNLILKTVLFLGFYKFYSWDGKGWSCLFSEMGNGAELGKKLIHPLNVSVFDEGLIVENVIQFCSLLISSQIRSTSFDFSLFWVSFYFFLFYL